MAAISRSLSPVDSPWYLVRRICGERVTSSPAILRVEAPAGDSPLIARGGARFWRVNFALFLGSFATFALLYCVQPLMPTFTRAFSISPAAASLSLSAATGVLAVAMISPERCRTSWDARR